MSEVERFDEGDCYCGLPVSLASSPEGEFVRYSDYIAAPPAVWSREKPTEAGWYWWRRPKVVPRVVEVGAAFGFGGVLVTPSGTVEQLSANDGEWSGPLRPPVEGKG